MRERLAVHFFFAAFGISWAWICLVNEGSLATLGAAILFAALSALVGWLSFNEKGWIALRVIGWTPIVAGAAGVVVGLVLEKDLARWSESLLVGAGFAVGSIVLYPLYVPIAIFTRRTA